MVKPGELRAAGPSGRGGMLRRLVLRRPTLVVLGLGVALVLAHGGVRLFTPNLHAVITADPVIEYRGLPNSRTRDLSTLIADHRIITYSMGAHGGRQAPTAAVPDADVPVVPCFGDSSTFGHGVDDHETYPHLLGERLVGEARVLNFGLSGYNTFQSWTLAQEVIAERRPPAIVFQLDRNDDDPMLPVSDIRRAPVPLRQIRGIWMYVDRAREMARKDRVTFEGGARQHVRELLAFAAEEDVDVAFVVTGLPPSLEDDLLQACIARADARTHVVEVPYYDDYLLRSTRHMNRAGNDRLAGDLERVLRAPVLAATVTEPRGGFSSATQPTPAATP